MIPVQGVLPDELVDYRGLFDLTGKRVAMVGAASGIGRECAFALAAHGATVLAADRDVASLAGVVEHVGRDSEAHPLDVTNSSAVEAFADRLGPVDALVFTPAMNIRKPLKQYTDDEFDRVTQLNVAGPFRLLRSFGPRMAAVGSGSIVGFSSIRATTVEPGQGVYAASKGRG